MSPFVPVAMIVWSSARLREIASVAEAPLNEVAATTRHGVRSSEQLKAKSLAKPSSVAAEAVDLSPLLEDSTCTVAKKKPGAPGPNCDLVGSSFHTPIKGSEADSKENARSISVETLVARLATRKVDAA